MIGGARRWPRTTALVAAGLLLFGAGACSDDGDLLDYDSGQEEPGQTSVEGAPPDPSAGPGVEPGADQQPDSGGTGAVGADPQDDDASGGGGVEDPTGGGETGSDDTPGGGGRADGVDGGIDTTS